MNQSFMGWNTLQAILGISTGIAIAHATGKRGALVYGAGALVGYFVARRAILPV